MATVSSARPQDVHSLRTQGQHVRLIDVRTPAEFEEVHAVDAIPAPLDRLDPARLSIELGIGKDDPVYMICKMGGRSRKACDQFSNAGFSNVINVDGGTDAWVAANLPVVRGEHKAFAINRQVQILAGSLVLLGVLLSLVSPWFLSLSAFIGAGLVFSGVTDTCGMGTVLAKMPWNQAPKSKVDPLAVAEACGGGG